MLWAVIIAGGGGTRFWPESRAARPKQFLKIFGKKTLLEETYGRISKLIPRSRVLVMTSSAHVKEARRLLRLPAAQVVGEPAGRNTAPAAILAASYIYRKDPAAVIAILPADHKIAPAASFRRSLKAAGKIALTKHLPVTFGIKPTCAHTGYGYLEINKRLSKGIAAVKQFHEKPAAARARAFVKSGRFLWNSGMFVWRAEDLLAAAKKYLPYASRLAQKILTPSKNFISPTLLSRYYSDMPNISIDYALMEPLAGKILAMPAGFSWSDLGGWQAFAELLNKDRYGNRSRARTVLIESRQNIIKSDRRLVAMIGIENCIVVDTDNALLIAARDKAENVRHVVAELKSRGLVKYL